MLKKNSDTVDYNENWPQYYYAIPTPQEKEKYLLLHPEDSERQNLFRKRYAYDYSDNFMQAWLSLKHLSTESIHFFNRKRMEKELHQALIQLCILDTTPIAGIEEEWKDFSTSLILLCVNSSSYRSAVFGMAKVSDRNTALRLCNDIDTLTNLLPSAFGLQKECARFHAILLDTFFSLIENGETYWKDYQSSR